MSDIPAGALPVIVFFSIALLEALIALLMRRKIYRLSDTVASIFMGLSMTLYSLTVAASAFVIYRYLYGHFHLFEFKKESVITFVVGLVLFDFISYWYHVWEHKINFMWASHAAHHHSEDFNLTAAFRQPITGGLWSWIFFCPIALLGVPPEVILICNTIHIGYQFIVHTKLVPSLGFLDYILITPTNHSVHHASNPEYIDKNFGSILVIWDILFKTFVREDKKIKTQYGITRSAKSFNPLWLNTIVYKTMLDQLIKARTLKEAFFIIFGAPYDPNAKDEPPAKKHYVFDPELSLFSRIYCVLQTALTTVAGIGVFWIHRDYGIEQTVLSFVLVLISMMNIGKLLEADERYFWSEGGKFLLMFGIFASGILSWPNYVSLFVFTWSGLSLAMILAYRIFAHQTKTSVSQSA